MPNVSFKIPINHVHLLDELVQEGFYKTRGEAIRESILSLINEIMINDEDAEEEIKLL